MAVYVWNCLTRVSRMYIASINMTAGMRSGHTQTLASQIGMFFFISREGWYIWKNCIRCIFKMNFKACADERETADAQLTMQLLLTLPKYFSSAQTSKSFDLARYLKQNLKVMFKYCVTDSWVLVTSDNFPRLETRSSLVRLWRSTVDGVTSNMQLLWKWTLNGSVSLTLGLKQQSHNPLI